MHAGREKQMPTQYICETIRYNYLGSNNKGAQKFANESHSKSSKQFAFFCFG
jgi:hypothetical protein